MNMNIIRPDFTPRIPGELPASAYGARGESARAAAAKAGPAAAAHADPAAARALERFGAPGQGKEAGFFAQRTIEFSAQLELKGSFELEDGRKVNFDLTVKVDARYQEAISAYGKTADPKAVEDFWSPEKTAKRIADFAESFLPAYSANHEGEGASDLLTKFFDLARAAIEKGFGEAKSTLGDLYGDPAEETRSLVMELLDAAQKRLAGAEAAPAPTDVDSIGA